MSANNLKFTTQQYEICVSFKTQNLMSMSAQFLPTNEHFLNQSIQLMRIKKDTVVATLERKSQKNLKFQIEQLVSKQSKYLSIKFIVKFDFLPEFSEEVRLGYVEKKQVIKNMQVSNFKADIQVLQKMIQSYQNNGVWKVKEIASVGGNSASAVQVSKIYLSKGRYLFRVSGIYTCSLAQMGSRDNLVFTLDIKKSTILKKPVAMNSYSGYSYPYVFEQVIQIDADGQAELKALGNFNQWTLTNNYIIIYPIPAFK